MKSTLSFFFSTESEICEVSPYFNDNTNCWEHKNVKYMLPASEKRA